MHAAPELRPIVVYDGGCPMCRRQARTIRRLDWARRLSTMPYDDAIQRFPEVSRGTLGDGLRVRFPDGTVTIGIDAVRSAAMRLPLGALGAWLLYVPGLRGLGARAYAWVSARRRRDCGDGCAVETHTHASN